MHRNLASFLSCLRERSLPRLVEKSSPSEPIGIVRDTNMIPNSLEIVQVLPMMQVHFHAL